LAAPWRPANIAADDWCDRGSLELSRDRRTVLEENIAAARLALDPEEVDQRTRAAREAA
jgi:hypothetical protein